MILRSSLFSLQASYRFLISTCYFAHLDGLSAENMIPELLSSAIFNKGDFCLIGQFFLRLSLINFTSGSGRLEKADEDFKKQQGQLA